MCRTYLFRYGSIWLSELEISGRFQRRGGIDINPFRGTSKKYLNKNFREFNNNGGEREIRTPVPEHILSKMHDRPL